MNTVKIQKLQHVHLLYARPLTVIGSQLSVTANFFFTTASYGPGGLLLSENNKGIYVRKQNKNSVTNKW